ncbi:MULTISPECIES: virulence factor family protein [unclassified Azospirillum]|uniref:virulence factor family protein n=1 Tax=unclassified Azospirillum TaxID=2630922 RepID=UPI000B6EB0A4|nr:MULTISPECIES: AcvB/VirJ family lysyl-phosphatidylglycerol hydrolase [unclassified Azospirillum]SNS46924.1 Type IV secretory pathway, VirJ component [Azospirillum sp. RU38E]SNS66085.1 Type IV secretory pathway, VirJ component [Azospirillum sp. RU37A]
MSKSAKLVLIWVITLSLLTFFGWRTWHDVPHTGYLPPTQPGGLLGRLHLYQPVGGNTGAVILFSQGKGWGAAEQELAERLADQGILVIGASLDQTLAAMEREKVECLEPKWVVEDISRNTQRYLRSGNYHLPVLAGIGPGATLALRIGAETSRATTGGVVAIDPAPGGEPKRPICPNDDINSDSPPLFTKVIVTSNGDPARATTEAATMRAPEPIHSPALPADALAEAVMARIATLAPTDDNTLDSLPLVEMPTKPALGVMAFVYSGDGGWRDLDKDVAERLVAEGIPTIGVDMLRYFWSYKKPAEAARDLSRMIRFYHTKWPEARVVLVGYSFGADVLPAIYNQLPEEDKAAVHQLSLLGVSDKASFEISLDEFLNNDDEKAEPVLPELKRIPPGLIQCFNGKEDEESLCPTLQKMGVETITTEGGHHFDGNYEHLAEMIANGAKRRLQATAPTAAP